MLTESLTAITRRANSSKVLRFSTPPKLYSYETLLEWVAQDLKDMAAELGPCIQEAHAMVGQRHVARHRHVAPADQPRIGARVVWGATWARRDEYTAVTDEIGDAMDAPGLERCRQG